jgi:hypothetical protein
MASMANTIQLRIVSVLCLFAILLVGLSPVACASPASHSMAGMPAAHCDPCCPAQLTASTACCLAHQQPAEAAVQFSHPTALLAGDLAELSSQRFATPQVIRAIILRSPPPPLRTHLRI